MTTRRSQIARGSTLLGSAWLAACATTAPTATFVQPDEIPVLRAELDANPAQPDLRLRYAAALYTIQDCEAATSEALRALDEAPDRPLGALVIGRCLEDGADPIGARDVYRAFLNEYPDVRGADAVRGREQLAARDAATLIARDALAREADLGNPQPGVTGVLAWQVSGDPSLDAFRLGLATLVSTDLAILQRFRMVERVQLDAVLGELDLGQSDRVDAATAPRVGRLVGAERLVQGVMTGRRDGDAVLTAAVLANDGSVRQTGEQSGRFGNLMRLQKALVVDIARQMGFELSRAEQALIQRNGTQSIAAFVAFSDGLLAEERGNYTAAIEHYGEAVRLDPNFGLARRRLGTAIGIDVGADALPVQITQLVDLVVQATTEFDPVQLLRSDPLSTSITDIASLQGETATSSGGGDGDKEIQQLNKPPSSGAATFPAIIRIIVQLGGRP